ncbi:MAG: type IIA DNA topoisomerase subunit B [Bacteroidetes bacterium]|nr:type IIA DNA topoisomerase subunit B [Bacteroidota bacterium]
MFDNVENYTEDNIQTLEWNQHIRLRPGMYIGKLGDGSSPDDGIYILIKEVMDNSIDEYMMGYGKNIKITVDKGVVTIRDYGRGIPLGSLQDVTCKMNTGGKYDTRAFKKSVGLNGVGIKAVNALSSDMFVTAFRDGEMRDIDCSAGVAKSVSDIQCTNEKNGTSVRFTADEAIFGSYDFNLKYIETMIKNYCYLNTGLVISLNGTKFSSKNGLLDLLKDNVKEDFAYEPIHLKGADIEVALTHGSSYGETYFSYANGQYTTLGGTHLSSFRESIVKTIKEFYNKNFEASDIRASIIAAISIKIENPMFESQTKTKLGSLEMSPNGVAVRTYVIDFMKKHLDNYLHKNPEIADAILRKIMQAEKERKEMSGVRKKAREFAKKVSLHNKKLRDCRIHLNTSHNLREESTIFITEGDSASGSITKSRNVMTQAVFSLRGKPLNTYGLTKKIIYQNEEFNLLQSALNIEEDIDNLRYNKIVVATDADVDGMHIRLLLISFFVQFFPDIIRSGHMFILDTPLFRVRNKKETVYCYTDEERQNAIAKLNNCEITRFKGLGEISPDEFRAFIGENIRLEKVRITNADPLKELLSFYMGKNTADRQDFIINNLRIEEDLVED